MYFDWIIVTSVITVVLILWVFAYLTIYGFKHIDQDTQDELLKNEKVDKINSDKDLS